MFAEILWWIYFPEFSSSEEGKFIFRRNEVQVELIDDLRKSLHDRLSRTLKNSS